MSLDERRAKSTAWALTFADVVTLLLTFFVLLLVMLSDAEKRLSTLIEKLLDETYEEMTLGLSYDCLLYTSPSPRDRSISRMPSSA